MLQFKSVSIRNRTIALIIIMTVIPFSVMLYSLVMERTRYVKETMQMSAVHTEQAAKLINQVTINTELLLNMLARLPIVQAGEEKTVNHFLLDLVSQYPQFSSIFIVDKSGQRWATTNQMSGAVSYRDRRYFANAISTGKFSSGEYAVGKVKKKPVFSFGLPVRKSSGEVTGVAVATIELEGLKSLLQKHSTEDYTSIIVMDHSGKILLHTSHAELEGKQKEDAVFRRLLQGPEEATMEIEGGQDTSRILAYKKLRLPGETSPYMYVLLEGDKSLLLSELNRKFGLNLSILLGSMCASLFLAYWFSKRFVLDRAEESELRYRALFTSAGDGILIMSSDGMLIEVNESFARMHGYSPEEMRQFGLKDMDTPETARLIPERMAKILAGEVLTFEVEHYHKDGHVFPLEVSASQIASNGKLFVQCFCRDITERKLAEAVLQ
jgi:PAS domain S-box-containing protein